MFKAHIIIVFCITSATFAAPQDEQLKTVRVVFQNTTASRVDIFLLDDSDESSAEPVEVLFAPRLPPGKQYLQASTPDVTWRVKNGESIIAEYVSNEESIQQVDIQEAVDSQSPVEIIVQNTTDSPVDVFWIDEDGKEVEIGKGLPPKREFTSQSLPGHSWVIKKSGTFVAEFLVDSHKQQYVDIEKLASWFQPVTLYFQNQTNNAIDVYWVDSQGKENCFTQTEDSKPLPLPGKQRMKQEAIPLSVWRIRQGGKLIAEYTADNENIQIVDVSLN